MNTDFTLEFKGQYIQIMTPPDFEITPERQARIWQALAQACRKHNCLKVFHEAPAPKRKMQTLDAFTSGSQASDAIPGLMLAICLHGYVTDETTKFFITVAFNRGATVEFFQDKKTALQWLNVTDADTPSSAKSK